MFCPWRWCDSSDSFLHRSPGGTGGERYQRICLSPSNSPQAPVQLKEEIYWCWLLLFINLYCCWLELININKIAEIDLGSFSLQIYSNNSLTVTISFCLQQLFSFIIWTNIKGCCCLLVYFSLIIIIVNLLKWSTGLVEETILYWRLKTGPVWWFVNIIIAVFVYWNSYQLLIQLDTNIIRKSIYVSLYSISSSQLKDNQCVWVSE